MAKQQINPAERLQAFVAKYPTQRSAAEALEISGPYLSDLLSGRREISDAILARLGLGRIVVEVRS
jgi:plasmid maintenance system antidote protein VapI